MGSTQFVKDVFKLREKERLPTIYISAYDDSSLKEKILETTNCESIAIFDETCQLFNSKGHIVTNEFIYLYSL